jgi:hypothetical protein
MVDKPLGKTFLEKYTRTSSGEVLTLWSEGPDTLGFFKA